MTCKGSVAGGFLCVEHCNCYCSSILVGSVKGSATLTDPDSRSTW